MIIKGEVSISSSIDMGDYVVSYDKENNKYETTKKGSASAETLCTKKDGVDLANLTYGNEFTCHLDSDRTFYVLETSEDNVTLIMDRNFTDDTVPKTIPWCIDGGENGEVCKNINSEEEGTPLKHIQDTFGTNVKVSFPTVSQIETASGKTIDNSMISGLPTWLYNYLAYNTTHKISDVYGYWTASYHASDKYGVWAVNCDGDFFVYGVVSMSEGYSIRPIITISKSDLC